MSRCCMVLSLAEYIPWDYENYVGVDKGALVLAKKCITMDVAIGDFDSVSEDDLKQIEMFAEKMIVLPKIKDETDFEAALKTVQYDEIDVYGGLGGRIDHELLNIKLITEYPSVRLLDDENCIRLLQNGTHMIEKNGYRYVSFFVLDDGYLTLEGVKYPLDDRLVTTKDLYLTSNEITEDFMRVQTSEDILMIQSNDKKGR